MKRITFMLKYFFTIEPLWFRLIIISTLAGSILFSSSIFTANAAVFQFISKLCATVFFMTYAIKFRRNVKLTVVFYVLSALCVYLAWNNFIKI